jgi:hypothetical protein
MTRKIMIGLAAAAIVSTASTMGASAQGGRDGGGRPVASGHSTIYVPEATYKYECKSRNVRTPWGQLVRKQVCAYAQAPGAPKPTIECEWRTKQVRTPWGRLPEKVCD